jgi:hypothetical protein
MDSVVVYNANPESLQAVFGFLRKEGFNPVTLEDPGSVVYCGRSSYLISVAAPRDEAAGAKSVLRKWDQAWQSEVQKITGKLAGPFLFSVMITAVFAVIFLFLGILSEAAALLFLVWIVVFALAANPEKITLKPKGHKDDRIRRGR